jgi:hypothetical protein
MSNRAETYKFGALGTFSRNRAVTTAILEIFGGVTEI